jgi:hypothetical protein
MVIYIFFMMYGIVVACNSAGCTMSSPEKLAVIAIAGGIELVAEIAGVVGIYKRKDK